MPRSYDKEFKLNAVRLVLEQGIGVTQVHSDLGVPQSTLEKWLTEYKRGGQEAFPGKGHLTGEEARFNKLQRENRELRMERDILKKAMAIFSSSQNKTSNS